MGIFKFLINLFTSSLDAKLDKISRRVNELRRQVPTKPAKTTSIDLAVFDIDTKSTSKEPNIFEPRQFEITISMRSLKEKRIELERKRIDDLKEQAKLNLHTIKTLIENEQAEKAGTLLVDTYSAIKELNEAEFLDSYANLLTQITQLKEALRQKEIERKRLQREKEEEVRRQKEAAELERKTRIEQERLRKEREAREYEETLRSEAQKRELERKRLIDTVTCNKADGEKFLDYLKRKGISRFYHFTDEQNIASIRRLGGLFSWYYCKNNGIIIPNAGGSSDSNALDIRHGLQDYVRLSFCSDHPMQYRLQRAGAKLVLLKIKIDVAAFRDTQFSNMNAAANAVQHGASFEDLERVNIYAVKSTYVRKTDEIFHEHQAECMVKTFIPIEYIINIDHPQRL
ncbi:MAG: DUF4433 domain-containing protein [Bacteroides sp.]|nr:DUF4433 domain-containing protein [Bacteroides sp.]